MHFESNLPIYLQIMNIIKDRIVSGKINGGDKLPSVRDFAQDLKVNPNTVQRAYQELERENLVFTQRGMGTFVSREVDVLNSLKKNRAREITQNFLKQMKKIGFKPAEILEIVSEWIAKEEDNS
jgi:DNA-binding transcriptional regulator YhcF (GntR family)